MRHGVNRVVCVSGHKVSIASQRFPYVRGDGCGVAIATQTDATAFANRRYIIVDPCDLIRAALVGFIDINAKGVFKIL